MSRACDYWVMYYCSMVAMASAVSVDDGMMASYVARVIQRWDSQQTIIHGDEQ